MKDIHELRDEIRKGKHLCQCGRKATDVHHLNDNHSDDRPENLIPICKLHHDQHHGISAQLNDLALVVRQFYALQDMRKAMANRVRAYEVLDYDPEHAKDVLGEIKDLEESIGGTVAEMVEEEAIYQTWMKKVKGIGPTLSAAVITRIGSVDRFSNISSLWAYSGLDVRDGQARHRKRGEKANWDAELRILITYKIPSQFIKAKSSFGRKLYDEYKSFYEQVHDERCPIWSHPDAVVNKSGTKATANGKGCSRKGHIDNMAKRKVGKMFLACLWLAWRELLGLEITEPYAAKLGHTHIIRPEDWID